MKNIFILILCLITSTITLAQSEGETKFGLIGGANVIFTEGNDWEDIIENFEDNEDYYANYDFTHNPKIGFHLGMSLDYFLKDNLALTSGLIYSQKGFAWKVENNGSTYYYGGIYNYTIEQTTNMALNYMDLPLGVKFITDNGLHITGGVLFSFLMSDNIDVNTETSGDDQYVSTYADDYEDFEDAFGHDPEDSTTGLFVGIGLDLNEKMSLGLKAQKTSSFGRIGSMGDENNNLTLQLSTGLTF